MRNRLSLLVGLTTFLSSSFLYATDEAQAAKLSEAKEIAKVFGGQLKGELEAAMKAGGSMSAVEVCKQRAPAIAQELSVKHQAQVYRTSLKPRSIPPQAWELSMLEQFNARLAKGEEITSIDGYEVAKEGDKTVLRYMKAVGVMPVCLNCHGTDISPDLQAKISALYPNDKATGYSAGQIRGAFSIQLPM
jgi:hypothetical protein